MKKTILRRVALGCATAGMLATLGAVAASTKAGAAVIGTGGQIEKLLGAPASAQEGALESNDVIRTWDEHQCVALPQDVAVDITQPGTYGAGNKTLTPGTIPAGTFVSSHFVHGDRIGHRPGDPINQVSLEGSITTDADILGIVATNGTPPHLNLSDFLGSPETTYATDRERTVEFGTPDFVIEVPDLRTVTVHFRLTSFVDDLRVITRCGAVAPPPAGAFAIGDRNAAIGADVTFWGAKWRKNNRLSGHSHPAAFKGFVDVPAMPSCGVGWTSRTGKNARPPAGPLPQYMAVIVTSTIEKSGKSLTGDTAHVVVVRTNAGYEPEPDDAGTGTVVGTIC